MGPTVTAPPVEPLASKDGVVYPFAGGQEITVTSMYGWREHPIRGGRRFHAGVDVVALGDPRVLTPQGGTVEFVDWVSGYGLTVVVKTASGHREQFAHLEETHVGPGETILPGQAVGIMGNTGDSTGSHLDFAVYKPGMPILDGNYQETTMDPLVYLTSITNTEQLPGGVTGVADHGDPFTGVADGSSIYDLYSQLYAGVGGRVATGFSSSTPESVFNNASPQRTPKASGNASDYAFPNNPEHNYGYEVLAQDTGYRTALADAGNRLGIPAQWLADVIAFETGNTHSPAITNQLGCVGFQFCPGGGLTDVAREMGVSDGHAASRLANMTRAEQVRWMEYYIGRYSNGGRDINTIEDLYALWNGGPGGLRSNAERRANLSDGNGTMLQHFKNLGNHVGRSYALSYDRVVSGAGDIHNHTVSGCPECARMINSFGRVLPHYEPR